MKNNPVIFDSYDARGKVLNRIEVQAKEVKDEDWLQRLLHEHPEVLPVKEFDDSYHPPISIGREIPVGPGWAIDNLYISPKGAITIVETKLWKNPEQHRTVVAQVIDYAKEISKWDYDQLNAAVLKVARENADGKKSSLDQIIAPVLDETGMTLEDFQERVISTLCNGEFLLLIVGDRISPNLVMLSESISGAPGLDFRLGLIEMQLYPLEEDKEWPLLVVPDIVGRTVEKTRGVIKIQYLKERPEIEIDVEEAEAKEQEKGKTTKETFLSKTPDDLSEIYERYLDLWTEKGLTVYWGVAGFSLRVPIEGRLRTVLDAYPEWAISLIRSKDAMQIGVSDSAYREYNESISPIPQVKNILFGGKKYIKHDSLTAESLMLILKATTDLLETLFVDSRREGNPGTPITAT